MIIEPQDRDKLTSLMADARSLERIMMANTVTDELRSACRRSARFTIKQMRARLRELEAAI